MGVTRIPNKQRPRHIGKYIVVASGLAVVGAVVGVGACMSRLELIEYPVPVQANVDMDVVDIHTHFFNHCDLSLQAVIEKFNVGDKSMSGKLALYFAKRFREQAGACDDEITRVQGSTTLEQRRIPRRRLHEIDLLRAAASDRLALAHRYFDMYPEVALTTPSLVDSDGWLNDPENGPPIASWERRHELQRELAGTLNEEFGYVRVLPLAGFNPMWAVDVDCAGDGVMDHDECNHHWSWRNAAAHGPAYMEQFTKLFDSTAGSNPPFVGVKIYPSNGFSPAPHCTRVATRWKEMQAAGHRECQRCDPGRRQATCHCNEIAEIVAMAPIREAVKWQGLPSPPAGSGCSEIHEMLMDGLRDEPIAQVKYEDVQHVHDADYSTVEMQVTLVAFLRLSAEIDRVMDEFYAMTAQLDLPILTHASPEGFALDDDYWEFGSTLDWERALDERRLADRRILLAHAGGPASQDGSFFTDVMAFIGRNPNIFIDLAASDADQWREHIEDLERRSSQIVYGSDFWMTTQDTDTTEFLRKHSKLFFAGRDAYLRTNAVDFLAPQGSGNRNRICAHVRARGLSLAPKLEFLCTNGD
jgi:Amidohydrolase